MAKVLGESVSGPGKPTFIGRCVSTGVGEYVWRLTEPLTFVTSEGYVLDIPEGFLTDFASVPRCLWWILPLTDGQYDAAAVVHDYAVRNRIAYGFNISTCADIFREALQASGVAPWKVMAMWRAVWAFNWISPGAGDGRVPEYIKRRANLF